MGWCDLEAEFGCFLCEELDLSLAVGRFRTCAYESEVLRAFPGLAATESTEHGRIPIFGSTEACLHISPT